MMWSCHPPLCDILHLLVWGHAILFLTPKNIDPCESKNHTPGTSRLDWAKRVQTSHLTGHASKIEFGWSIWDSLSLVFNGKFNSIVVKVDCSVSKVSLAPSIVHRLVTTYLAWGNKQQTRPGLDLQNVWRLKLWSWAISTGVAEHLHVLTHSEKLPLMDIWYLK